jgi:hypothetical protein
MRRFLTGLAAAGLMAAGLPMALLTASASAATASPHAPTATAMASTAGSTAGTGNAPVPVINLGNGHHLTLDVSKAKCQATTSVPGVTKRCSLAQRLPLSDLPAAARAERAKDMRTIQSRSAASGAAITPPSQCGFSSTEFRLTGIANPDRFTSCSATQWIAINYKFSTTPPFITVLGTFFWEDQQWESYSATSGTFHHGMVTLGYKTGAAGDLAGGITADLFSSCDIFASICSATSQTVPDPQPVAITPASAQSFGWTESDAGPSSTTAKTDNIMRPDLGVFWEDISTIRPTSVADTGHLSGRCDTLISTTDGCVNENYTPIVTYSAIQNPLVGPVAQHIYDAQKTLSTAWGVPAAFASNGAVLNRDTSQADITANNRAACAHVVTGPGQNCDEFPLASTFQGAAFQRVFSAVPVPASANFSQGGITGTFYSSNRVIDDDGFYVLAVLPNGTRSWG